MTLVLIAALVAVSIAHICLLDRKDKRERTERAELLQRIQAPRAAVAEHHAVTAPPQPESDGLPMSDQQIADLQERDRIISWMEAVENGDETMLDNGVPR